MSAGVTVLGIDPGSTCTGWGVVRETSGVLSLVACGCIRPKSEQFSARIGEIFCDLSEIIALHQPQEAAVEDVFGGKSIMSALKLGQARGAAVAACAAHNLAVFSYPPTKVKQALVGAGRADKSQVAFMVARFLGLGAAPKWAADTSDALGVAVCHLNMRRMLKLTGQH